MDHADDPVGSTLPTFLSTLAQSRGDDAGREVSKVKITLVDSVVPLISTVKQR
jgi:hypothetical protein